MLQVSQSRRAFVSLSSQNVHFRLIDLMDEVIYFVNIIDIYNILLLWSCITLGCPIGLPVLATCSVVTMSSSEPSQNHPHKSIFSGVFFGVHVILLLIDIHSCFLPMQLHVPVQSYKNRRERANDLIPPCPYGKLPGQILFTGDSCLIMS